MKITIKKPPFKCHGQGCRVFLGMGKIPPLIGILIYNGYINPYYWVEFPIPYYMESSWEFSLARSHIWGICLELFVQTPQANLSKAESFNADEGGL